MAIQSSRIVHTDEKRHKCHFCGAVRFESKMEKLKAGETKADYHFSNDQKCWRCKPPCWVDKK